MEGAETKDSPTALLPGEYIDENGRLFVRSIITELIDPAAYQVVTCCIDLTGKNLADEICQIGAYSMVNNLPRVFGQYVMPYRNMSVGATRIHGLRIDVSFGAYRVLKDVRTKKSLRTKSAYAALHDFLAWLKSVKGDKRGVVLVHDGNLLDDMMPFLVMALEHYHLLNEFFTIVTGCISAKTIVEKYTTYKDKPTTLKALLRRVLMYDEKTLKSDILRSAKSRAHLLYKVAAEIIPFAREGKCEIIPMDFLDNCTKKEEELQNLATQRVRVANIKSLYPIFVEQLKLGLKARRRAVSLQKYLADIGYKGLKEAYMNTEGCGEDNVKALVKTTKAVSSQKDFEELVKRISTHFALPVDCNSNTFAEKGQGDTGMSAKSRSSSSEDDDDDEFEEARNEDPDFEEARRNEDPKFDEAQSKDPVEA